jgi:hypothetical protein
MTRTVFAILALWIAVQAAGASPVDDLASPDPGVRATAAKTIRKLGLYHPTSRDQWDMLLTVSKKGDTIKATLEHLRAAGASVLLDEFVPADVNEGFQLDDFWMLEASFHDGKLLSRRVVPSPRLVNVPPPPGYYDWAAEAIHLENRTMEYKAVVSPTTRCKR